MKQLKKYNKDIKTEKQENEDQKDDIEKDKQGFKYLKAKCAPADWVIRQKYIGSQWVATHLPDRMLAHIQKQGGKAFQVGGCVRDYLINLEHSKGLVSKDLDCVVTGLSPQEVYKIFQKYGYLSVGCEKDQSEDPGSCSRFTFRPRSDNHQSRQSMSNGKFFIDDIDVSYPNKHVDWKTGLKYDLLERDFLWNSMQLDLQTGHQYEPVKVRDGDEKDPDNWELQQIDLSDRKKSLAVNDIKNKQITVLKQSVFDKPEAVQRCINFKHRFGFRIIKSTQKLMLQKKMQWEQSSGSDNQVAKWAGERVQNTLRKTLKKSESVSSAVKDFHKFGLIERLFREIKTERKYVENSDFTFNTSTLQQLKQFDQQRVQDKADLFPFFLGALVRNEQQIKKNSDQVFKLLTKRLKLKQAEQALAQFAAKMINLFEDQRKVNSDCKNYLDMYRRRLQEIVVKNLIYITKKRRVQSCLIDGTETSGKLNKQTVRHERTDSIIKMSMERVSIIVDGLQQQFMGRPQPFMLSRCSPILMSQVNARKAKKVSRVTNINPLIPGRNQFIITFQDLTDISIGIGSTNYVLDENMLDVIAIAYQHNLKVGGSNADKKILLRVGFKQLFNKLNYKATHKKILLDKIIEVWRENIKTICQERLKQDDLERIRMDAIRCLKDMVSNPVVEVQVEAAGLNHHQSYFTQKQNIAKFIKLHEKQISRLKDIPKILVADLQSYDEYPGLIDPCPSSTEPMDISISRSPSPTLDPMDISPPQSPNGSDLKFGIDVQSMGSIERFQRKNHYVRAPTFIPLI